MPRKKPANQTISSTTEKTDITVAQLGIIAAAIAALITVIGMVISGYFGYLGARTQVELPIQATQTAEAKPTAIAQTLTAQSHSQTQTASRLPPVKSIPTFTPTSHSIKTSLPTMLPKTEWVEGKVLLDEDFENGSTENWFFSGENWNIVQDENGNSVLEGINGGAAQAGENTWENYAFELKTRVLQISTAPYGETFDLSFRHSGGCYGYNWNMNETFTNMGRVYSESCSWHPIKANNYEPLIGNWNTFRIELMDDHIVGYANGIKLVDAIDTAVDRAKFGRVGFDIKQNAKVWFDDIRVIELVPK